MTNTRELEDGITVDLKGQTYAGYLELKTLLSAQQPITGHHDEMLFIIQHQTTELWIKLIVHELRSANALLAEDELAQALKRLARIKHIQTQITDQWSVLATLTPAEYLEFRDRLGQSSGFQSAQYRELEFLLGNKNAAMIKVFDHDPDAQAILKATLAAPSVYDEFLALMARRGYAVPRELLERDVTKAHTHNDELVHVFRDIYRHADDHWDVYEACEELVDIEDAFQLWRFRHLRTVQRIIGFKKGTGGSSGVPFLQRALDLTFFPELYSVRTEV
ncbi:tryptophan 2,3-dioxygenase [Spelaeicoccus albus]|uniref:Tryptophan 2,3-dioxygenase n=1 Tax=Spelaeicoccus albus TaxID=1280376 RepID=A0A7Z0D1C5_9MICO|nr:tryptophan 2,3-dioxygenase [Spelaeicoccus albus]NYI65860.1 tryptophan 2,3-dioxygenase [Spelaeicoccus albus]